MSFPFSADRIAGLCRSGQLSPLEVVNETLRRIERLEPRIEAFLHVDSRGARARARKLEGAGSAGKDGLLYGVPVAVKDNICVKGMPQTCASRILDGYQPPYDAFVVERIEAQGGIVVGKTNMDEFGMGSSTEHSAVKKSFNPWGRKLIPGGSSGGSAAAVAARVVPLALGSDTGGSIRQPAAMCGAVGFKPTYGTVSRFGLTAFASSLDQIGPMAADVRGAALLFEAIRGHDPRDSTSLSLPAGDDLSRLPDDLDGLRIGVPAQYMDDRIDAGITGLIRGSLGELEEMGASIREIDMPLTGHAIAVYYLVATAEASSNLARYDGVRFGPRREGDDVEASYAATRNQGFGAEVKRRIMLGTFALSAGYHEDWYMKALKVRRMIRDEFRRAFREVDLIAGPVSPLPAFEVDERIADPLAMYLTDSLTVPASLAGLPAVSLPCGLLEGRKPVGLQVIGPALKDGLVLQAARAFEKNRKGGALIPPLADALDER